MSQEVEEMNTRAAVQIVGMERSPAQTQGDDAAILVSATRLGHLVASRECAFL